MDFPLNGAEQFSPLLWRKWKYLWLGSSFDPKPLDDVIGLLLD